jgi:hypothetical protein
VQSQQHSLHCFGISVDLQNLEKKKEEIRTFV